METAIEWAAIWAIENSKVVHIKNNNEQTSKMLESNK